MLDFNDTKKQIAVISICLFFLMFPVTGIVPILKQLMQDRFPEISIFNRHVFMSVNMMGAFIFVPLIAILSDKLKKRKIIITSAFIINGIILFCMSFEWSFSQFLVWRFFEGCAHITALSLLMTLALDYIKSGISGKVMGFVGASISLGVAFGAPIGGLVGQGSSENVFIYGALLLFCVALFSFLFIKDKSLSSTELSKNKFKDALAIDKRLIVPFIFTFIDRLTVGFIISTLTLYLATELNASSKEIGLIMAIFLIPFSLLIYPSAKLSEHKNKLFMMIIGSIVYGFLLLSIGFISLEFIKWLMLAAGVASALMYAPSLVLVAKLAGENNKALAMGAFNSIGSVGFIIGPLFGGSIVQLLNTQHFLFTGYEWAFILVGLSEIICALVFIPYLKKLKI